ncbi:MAG: WGR domain-containing protein [Myxococcota bacterium]
MKALPKVRLFFQEGSSDKLYEATIVEEAGAYTVKVAWGRRGAKLNEGTKAVRVDLATATRKFEALVREKTGKGYQEITEAQQPAAVAPPEGQGSGSLVGGRRARVGPVAQLLTPLAEHELSAFLEDHRIIAQQKVDGQRVIARVGLEIVATNREGQRTSVSSEILEGLRYLPSDTIVDGELVAEELVLFDVLQVGSRDLRARGYLERYTLLAEELEPALTGAVRVLPIAEGTEAKRRLHQALVKANAEGIVFKERDAPYTSGRPASGGTQRKLKFIKSADVIIVENAGNAYQMSVWDGDRLFEVGRVFAGTTNASRRELDARLGRGEHPVAEVRYLYATADHQLFQPVFVRLRDDKEGQDCHRAQLVDTDRRILA